MTLINIGSYNPCASATGLMLQTLKCTSWYWTLSGQICHLILDFTFTVHKILIRIINPSAQRKDSNNEFHE
jgi:hypothetical protein